MMRTAAMLLSLALMGCAGSRSGGGVRPGVECTEPSAEFYTAERKAEFSASVGKIKDIISAEASTTRKVERIRAEVPGLQAVQVLEYRMCMAYRNGILSKEEYNEFFDKLLPLLQQNPVK